MASSIQLTTNEETYIELSGEDIKSGIGKVLQVVSFITAIQSSQTVDTADVVVAGITKEITPKGNNSKFLVEVRWFGETNVAWDTPFNIHMDGERVNLNGLLAKSGLAMARQSYVADDNNSTPENVEIHTLVDTSSIPGVPIVFSLVAYSSGVKTIWTNKMFTDSGTNYEKGTSEIIITEIGIY